MRMLKPHTQPFITKLKVTPHRHNKIDVEECIIFHILVAQTAQTYQIVAKWKQKKISLKSNRDWAKVGPKVDKLYTARPTNSQRIVQIISFDGLKVIKFMVLICRVTIQSCLQTINKKCCTFHENCSASTCTYSSLSPSNLLINL